MSFNSLKQKTISSIFWKLLERGGNSTIQLLVQIVMARLLTPNEFGVLAILLVFIGIGNIISQSGLNTALVQSPNVRISDYSTVFWISLVISVFLYFVIFFCAPLIASFYSMFELVEPMRALSIVIIINSYNAVLSAIVQRKLEFKIIFRATLVSVVVSGMAGIVIALNNFGLWSLVIQQLVFYVVNGMSLFAQIRWFPSIQFDLVRAKALFSFGWKLLLAGLLDQGYQSFANLLIGKQFSASLLGVVSQGMKYPQAIGTMLDGAIQPVMLSAVARIQYDSVCVKNFVRRALKTSSYLIIPCMAFLAVSAESLVRFLLGDQWLPMVPFMQMYCFIYALLPIQTTNLQALNGLGRSDVFFKLEIIKKSYGIVFMLFAALVLQDIYAVVGAYMLSAAVSTFVNAYPVKKIVGYSYREQLADIGPAFIVAVPAIVAATIVSTFAVPVVVTILLQGVVLLTLYFGLSALFRVEEFLYIRKIVNELMDQIRRSNNE